MAKYNYSEAALAILRLEGLELTDQEIQILVELDQLPYSDEQINAFLKADYRPQNVLD